jgi:YD repeat-containing protein
VDIPGAGYITHSSYKWNRPTEVTLPGGSRKQYEYDPLMRVKSITAKDPGQNLLLNYHYNYDRMDNITAKVTEHGEYGYGYDDLYRLASTDNPVQDAEGFSYDAVGNRLTVAGVADDWSYNDDNELQGYDNVAFEYDDNGNMTKKIDVGQVANYIYNVEDRLTEVWNGAVGSGSLISYYYYDPFGRRLWKEVTGVRTYFVYADEGLVAEVDAAGNVVKSYGYKPGSTWTTDPLFMKVGGQYYFYQNDHLGTPQKLTAVNGAVVWSAKYSSFGEAAVHPSSTIVNNLRFPGQYFD